MIINLMLPEIAIDLLRKKVIDPELKEAIESVAKALGCDKPPLGLNRKDFLNGLD